MSTEAGRATLRVEEEVALRAYAEALKEDIDSGMAGALRKVEPDLRRAGFSRTVRTVRALCTSALLHLLTRDERGEYLALRSMAQMGCRIFRAREELYRRTGKRLHNRTFAMMVRMELQEFLAEHDEQVATASDGSK